MSSDTINQRLNSQSLLTLCINKLRQPILIPAFIAVMHFAIPVAVYAADFIVNTQTLIKNDGHIVDGNDSITITTSGAITTNGDGAILATGTDNVINNQGSIRAIGDTFVGIEALNKNTIDNNGTITASGIDSVATSVFDDNTITNTGSMTSAGDNSIGLLINNSNVVNNNGTITANGTGATGIIANSNNVINQFGSVTANGDAFLLLNNNTLNLHAGAQITGAFNLGTNTILNIHTNPAHSVNWIFNPTQLQGNAPNIIGSTPVFQNLISATQLQVTTLGPTASGASHNVLAQFTGNLSHQIQQRLNSGIERPKTNFLSSVQDITAIKRIDTAFDAASTPPSKSWLSLYGSQANYNENNDLEYRSGFAGIAGGYDWSPGSDFRLGLMGGFLQGGVLAKNAQSIVADEEMSGFYGGLYGRKDFLIAYIDFSITGGLFDHSQQRSINSNINVTDANSEYSSLWFSPEVALGTHLHLNDGWTVSPSTRLRYASQWIDSYSESGALSTKIGSQRVEIAEASVEWAAIKTTPVHQTTLRAGYFHRTSFGDRTHSVTLFGQTQSMSLSTRDKRAAYLAANSRVHLNSNIDLNFGTRLEMGEEFMSIQGDIKLVARF